MKTHLLLFGFVFLMTGATAQSLDRIAITSCAGSAMCGTNIFTDYSVGETFVATLESSGIVLTQGFMQPFTIQIITAKEADGQMLSIKIFPNPASEILHINLDRVYSQHIRIALITAEGRLVCETGIHPAAGGEIITDMDVRHVSDGTYWLSIYDSDRIIKSTGIVIQH